MEVRRGAGAALVMELVEGPTLADRLAGGSGPGRGLTVGDVIGIGRQIADALEAAHEKGIIHRDLKPANVKIGSDGRVKVLDFGLARLHDPTATEAGARRLQPDLSASPTMMSPAQMTSAGTILGTAAYMSPEQARGKPADRRADIWAFGCVLYEMLAGRQPFETGETVSDAVAAILTREPDWTALPADTPAAIRRLLRRGLEKDPARRLHHIADVRLELEDAAGGPAEPSTTAVPAVPSPARWARALPWTIAALALAAAAFAVSSRTGPEPGDLPVRRLELTVPEAVELFIATSRTVALSPDGSRLAFVGSLGGSRQVFVRPLDAFEATPLRGSDGATACFFSPDGRSVGLVTAAGVLKTISLADGLVATVTDSVSFLYGAAWSADGSIVFVRSGSLWQVAGVGGTPARLTTLESGETQHAWPAVLPGGRAILFGVSSGQQSRIDALIHATGERRTVVERGTLPMFAASGHLMFFRDGELFAAAFDVDRLELTGPPIQAIANLPASVSAVPVVDVSQSGTVVYAASTAVSRLVWVSREGTERPLNETRRSFASPRLSADGTRVLVNSGGDLWIQDTARATFTRLTPAGGRSPPDSRSGCRTADTWSIAAPQVCGCRTRRAAAGTS